jgi:hypothetical protein
MAANSKQARILVRTEKHYLLEVILNVQIGNNICLDLSNERYLLAQCWIREKNTCIPKVHRKIQAINCNFFALQDL